MSGIVALFAPTPDAVADEAELVLATARSLQHRGPNGNGLLLHGRSAIAHTRLAIVDVEGGRQPMVNHEQGLALAVDGEIYNHRLLRDGLRNHHTFHSRSDSEIILHLYAEHGTDCIRQLDGMFAFIVTEGSHFLAARDALGIKPLYFGRDARGGLWFVSEFKSFPKRCKDFSALPPGNSLTERGIVRRWYAPRWTDHVGHVASVSPRTLIARLDHAVHKQLMADVPVGVFLSGGLDSSIVAALVRRSLTRVCTFAVGVDGAADLGAARYVARELGTEHHELTYSLRDAAQALSQVIYHLESYDPALVRSAVPCYLLSRLAAEHVKVGLAGDGADELFAGYAHFERMHDPSALHRECAQLLQGLHALNLQRLDRMTMAHGVEGRVPFLDLEFVDFAMSLDPRLKMHHSSVPAKQLLRQACVGYLPDEIVTRGQLDLSAGAGADQILSELADRQISPRDLYRAARNFPTDTPTSKEALLYRRIFEEFFPGESAQRAAGRLPTAPPS